MSPKIESGEAATREGAGVHGAAVSPAPPVPQPGASPDSLTPKVSIPFVHSWAAVASWVAAGVPGDAIDDMAAAELAKYRAFLMAVFNHASATIDYIDAPARLKAVKS